MHHNMICSHPLVIEWKIAMEIMEKEWKLKNND